VTEPITLADDPNLAHLIDLLDMLRGPEVTSLWGEDDHSIGKKFDSRLRPSLPFGQRLPHLLQASYVAAQTRSMRRTSSRASQKGRLTWCISSRA
jgi:hypothetical protein